MFKLSCLLVVCLVVSCVLLLLCVVPFVSIVLLWICSFVVVSSVVGWVLVAVVGLCCHVLMFPPFALTATRALFREIALRHLRIDFNIVALRALREPAATRKLNKCVIDDGRALQ